MLKNQPLADTSPPCLYATCARPCCLTLTALGWPNWLGAPTQTRQPFGSIWEDRYDLNEVFGHYLPVEVRPVANDHGIEAKERFLCT